MDAALRVLNSSGYGGATIAAIRDEAAVSTGALNHQFSSKAKLMAAVVERFSEQRIAAYNDAVQGEKGPIAIIDAIMETTDAVMRLPEMAAVSEIHLARRNDPELEELTRPIQERFNSQLARWLDAGRHDAGYGGGKRFDNFILLSFAVYRGLALELRDNAGKEDVRGALALWREFTRHYHLGLK